MLAASFMPDLARIIAQVACAVGVGVWVALLGAPTAVYPPAALSSVAVSGSGAEPVSAWFGGAQTLVKIDVLGLIAGVDGYGSALLSVDGAGPQAYRVGDELASGVVLHKVSSKTVTIAQDGNMRDVAAPADPRLIPQGISVVDDSVQAHRAR